ncbi:Biosynthetic arginine decarboxylase [Auxenochlorella protothecoides]|uniref:Arginine decarboxylase n=1 Tax=Auxenochlorella protothecoides TaxID=3075 RepID=A0A087SIW6_AUXPR|nr:Biosynthetic arginine decarboxylase [Auxenochlorella protothecoides]KFM25670.1 Biosynthetic arginine decarboxylase [Auxenochlorella protothecoides]
MDCAAGVERKLQSTGCGYSSRASQLYDLDTTSAASSGDLLLDFKPVTSEADLQSSRSPSQARQLGLSPALGREGSTWSTEASRALYNVDGWGCGYVDIAEEGNLAIRPLGEDGPAVDLPQLVEHLKERGLLPPLLLRFPSIACHRLEKLRDAFRAAIERFEYQGCFRSVFPVKSNPDRLLLQGMLDYSWSHEHGHGLGLEVGSKAELTMALSMIPLPASPAFNLICNGCKDAEYMELAMHAGELGVNAVVVMEQYSEVRLALRVAAKLGVRPRLGVRAKLATRHSGHWGSTSGDGAKFGLRAREIVAAVGELAAAGMLDCLVLLHFHVGSQITNIRMVKEVMREASFLYAELVKARAGNEMGAGLRFLDVGGGLAVDYDGSFTDSAASMAYSLQSYANDIEVCVHRGIPPPTLISESGRAVASHATVVVFDVVNHPVRCEELREEEEEVVDSVEFSLDRPLTKQLKAAASRGKGRYLLTTFKEVFDNITADAFSLRESYSDACYFKEDALRAFKLGVLSLVERARVDVMFDATCDRIRTLAGEHSLPLPDALQPTAVPGVRLYHVNLSVFQSAVDAWGIGQLFPVMPLARLGEEPRGEPYRLAMFLTGVYQEVMGSVHNMYGRLNTAVVWAEPGRAGVQLVHVRRGESVGEVLVHPGYDPATMIQRVHEATMLRVNAGNLPMRRAEVIMQCYRERMAGYT